MKTSTVFITGASSGIGLATALYFQQQGWQVIATMRSPKPELFAGMERITILPCDVTDPSSVQSAVNETLQRFESIDVVVNNAGYGLSGVFEATPTDSIRKQFEVNFFGAIEVMRAVLPHMRAQKRGTIINITSIGGLMTFPLYSSYHATKWALEGFSESMHYELRPLGIRIKMVEPGPIKTDFYQRSAEHHEPNQSWGYASSTINAMKRMIDSGNNGSSPDVVAQRVYEAAMDRSSALRYPTGLTGRVILLLRRLTPNRFFYFVIRRSLLR